MNGIIILDKPQGFTSFDGVAVLRGLAHEKKIGHTGTLDPMATGVLPILLGRAAKALNFLPDTDKEYVASFRLGERRDTGDITGQVVEESPALVSQQALEAALPAFRGEILQVPPMYSAVSVGGKRLYELARKGLEVERQARPVTVSALELLSYDAQSREGRLRVACSKGTYVRTLCHDIGQALGCGGTMYALRRTQAAGFTLDQAVTLEAVQASADPAGLLLPVEAYFAHHPALTLPSARAERKVRNGNPLSLPGEDGVYRVYSPEGAFLALSRLDQGRLTTIKSFFEV